MNFINLTPHSLTIEGIGELPPSGVVARINHIRTQHPPMLGPNGFVRVIRQDYGPVQNIPPAQPDTAYIVSAVVVSSIMASEDIETQDRLGVDIFAPDTGPDALREKGQVVAVRGLVW